MFEWIKTYFLEEWDVLTSAPFTFLLATIVTGSLIWLAMRWRYEGIIDTLKSRLAAKDDKITDYKEKLEGASPDEAKAVIDALEKRLEKLEPRKLDRACGAKMVGILKAHAGKVDIAQDMQSADARLLAIALADVFSEAGWTVQSPAVLGPSNPPVEGIAVTVRDIEDLSEQDKAIFAAMEACGHPFDARGGLISRHDKDVDAEILITSAI
jgi:hypothetical protein